MHPLTSSDPPLPVVFQAVRQFETDPDQQIQSGLSRSDEHLAILLARLLNRMLHTKLRCPELIEEVRQETMFRVLVRVRKGQVRQPDRLNAFALGVCQRVLYERLRQECRYVMSGNEMREQVDHRPAPDREVSNREQREYVARILALLTSKDRDILRLTFLEGLTRAEACKHLGIDREHFRVMLYRAKARFRKAAEDDHSSTSACATRS